jgi:hypothetical protein
METTQWSLYGDKDKDAEVRQRRAQKEGEPKRTDPDQADVVRVYKYEEEAANTASPWQWTTLSAAHQRVPVPQYLQTEEQYGPGCDWPAVADGDGKRDPLQAGAEHRRSQTPPVALQEGAV